jgi:hypothetical protein
LKRQEKAWISFVQDSSAHNPFWPKTGIAGIRRLTRLRRATNEFVDGMEKTAVITQSNYLPWRGYFDLVRSAEDVVLLDCVQYTRSDWRNRNLIKTQAGLKWLTIPVRQIGSRRQTVDEVEIADNDWTKRHIRTIEPAYGRANFYAEVSPWLFAVLESVAAEKMLCRVNELTLRMICERLGIKSNLRRCTDIIERDRLRAMGQTERLVKIVEALGANRYLTGPKARSYLDLGQFDTAGIEVIWMNYDGYPSYPQLWCEKFEPGVSVIDLLFNTGLEAPNYLERR